MSITPQVINQAQARELLAQVDVPQILRTLFRALAAGHAVQPAQQLVAFPHGAGDFINYLGVLAEEGVYGVKTSPYIVREQGPLVTAWTLLMSMQTGEPLLLCDAAELTTARTAATTALAVEALAPQTARRLAIIGSGKVAQAHLHYVKNLRDWQIISVFSPSLATANTDAIKRLDPRLSVADSCDAAVADADVILLCTSSAGPVIDPSCLSKPALITSISTNAPRAHEVPPQSLNAMQVFCDYRQTTPRLGRRDADRR
jgi:L-arginine dehydrogenase